MTSTLPRSRSTDRRYYGVVEALVAKVTGDPEHECQVTLRFPFFDGGTAESDWCRVAQPYAGNGYGAVFVPEEGDEVLVAFIHGDMRFPIVLGGLYNGRDKPPTDRTTSKDQKMIRTKHGHQVVLDDSQGQEAIRITTADGHELILDDASGTVAVTGNGVKITLEDSGTVTVQGSTVTVEADKINLGSAAATLSLILGEQFMTIFNAHSHALPFPPVVATVPSTTVPPLTPAVFSQIVKVTR
jgi:phage baseplate assembly protein V